MSQLETAREWIAQQDPILARLIDRLQDLDGIALQASWTEPRPALESLIRAIVSQQVSAAAARTVFARFKSLLDDGPITPQAVLGLPESTLRSVGLSVQKAGFLHNTCTAIMNRQLDLAMLRDLTDEQVLEALQAVRGIGRWTAEMFLISHLQRPDVLPCHDVGIQKGVQIAYGFPTRPAAETVADIGIRWCPYRTLASRYLWAAVNLRLAPEAISQEEPTSG